MTSALTPTHDLPTITEGDDVDIPVSFQNQSGDAVDITGWSVTFSVADRNFGAQSAPILLQKTTTNHSAPTQGETGFHLDPPDTAGLAGTKRYDIQIERDNGVIQTVVLGSVAFLDGVTDSPGSGTDTTGSFSTGGIAVTMADGEISVSVSVAGSFSTADALDAVNSNPISPPQVGTAADPVGETYTRVRFPAKTLSDHRRPPTTSSATQNTRPTAWDGRSRDTPDDPTSHECYCQIQTRSGRTR